LTPRRVRAKCESKTVFNNADSDNFMKSKRHLKLLLGLVAFATVLGTLFIARDAQAIPAFARQYGRDCQTCHVAFPKLTPFGEAFRRNGWRYPGGEDAEFLREPPISLGQEQYKQMFPHTVWPGRTAPQIPLAVMIAARADYEPHTDAELSFANMAGNVGLIAAASIDDTFSGWAGVTVLADGQGASVEIERVFAVVQPFDEPIMNLRLGRFDPTLWNFSNHRLLGFTPWMMATPVRDNPFTPLPTQTGFELGGVFGEGRWDYAVGVVEGGGDRVNDFKDVYAHLGAKLGGLRLDGKDADNVSAQPWRENSVQVGAFGYFGQAALGDPALASQEDRFIVVGGDASANLRDFNLLVAGSYGRNQRPSFAEPNQDSDTIHLMSQLDIVVYPWLVPIVRYEWRDVAGADAHRASGGLYVLLRANVRTQLLAAVQNDGEHFELAQVLAGLNLAL
jgi:hypothetical protein